MKQPQSLEELATALLYRDFKGLTPIESLIDDGTPVSEFFDNVKDQFLSVDKFARYIPVVQEVVSTKTHQYKLKTHIVLFLDNGVPFIFTPTPTILHKRAGRSLNTTREGSHLMIPHNCSHYLVLAIRDGCNIHPKTHCVTNFTEMSVVEYKE